MSSTFKNWTSDNYAFVGKAFDFAYADRLNKLSPVVGEVNAKSIDYELTGSGGYGEAPRYDGENLNEGSLKRGFKTVITPVEYTLSIPVGYKEAKVDKMGETKKVGTKLGDSMALTVYLHVLRMFANAWNTDGKHNGGEVEHDEDIEKKMTAFFDTAQKTLAQIRRIVREYALPLAMGKTAYEMPPDFSALYRVWADGRITRALRWRAGKLLVPEGYAAEIVVEYFAVPNTIPQDAPDSCEFEIDAEACECMPYYVAAQQLLPDLVLDYGAMLQMYDRAAAQLAAALPGGNRRVAQSLFRR